MPANVSAPSYFPVAEKPSSASMNSWVAVFPGARDAYQVPIALREAGLLKKLVTDFYSPLDWLFARNAVGLLTSSWQLKLNQRFSLSLPSRLVQSHPLYALATWRNPQSWIEHVSSLGEAAGHIAAKHGCGLLAYSHIATSASAKPPH